MKKKRVAVNFQGRVQGVGFRFTTVHLARSFAVTGYVKNCMDGSVELVAEGDESVLADFLREILSSGLKRYITTHRVDWDDARNSFQTFGVKY